MIHLAVQDAADKTYKGRQVENRTDTISTVYYRQKSGGNRVAAALGGALAGLFTGTFLGEVVYPDAANETGVVVGAGVGTILGSGIALGLAEHYHWQEITLIVK